MVRAVMNLDLHTLGAALRILRKAAKLSQDEVAAKMASSPSTVSNWETGKVEPELNKLWSFLEAVDSGLCDLERTMLTIAGAEKLPGQQLLDEVRAEAARVGDRVEPETADLFREAFGQQLAQIQVAAERERRETARQIRALQQKLEELDRRLGGDEDEQINSQPR